MILIRGEVPAYVKVALLGWIHAGPQYDRQTRTTDQDCKTLRLAISLPRQRLSTGPGHVRHPRRRWLAAGAAGLNTPGRTRCLDKARKRCRITIVNMAHF